MKCLPHTVVASLVLIGCVQAHAQQSGAEISRAQVREELISLERAGYTPGYPASLSIAQERMNDHVAAANAQGAGDGSPSRGSSQAGRIETLNPAQSIYFGL